MHSLATHLSQKQPTRDIGRLSCFEKVNFSWLSLVLLPVPKSNIFGGHFLENQMVFKHRLSDEWCKDQGHHAGTLQMPLHLCILKKEESVYSDIGLQSAGFKDLDPGARSVVCVRPAQTSRALFEGFQTHAAPLRGRRR